MSKTNKFHLLNGDMLTPEQKENYKLHRMIEKFKEYDKKRTEHVKILESYIEQLKAQLLEYDAMMRDGSDVTKLRLRIKNQTEANKQLQNQLQTLKYIRDNNIRISLDTHEDVQNKLGELLCEVIVLRKENQSLKDKVADLRKKELRVCRELGNQVSKIASLEKKLNEQK